MDEQLSRIGSEGTPAGNILKKKRIRKKRPPVIFDEEGWAKFPEYKPLEFALVEVRDKDKNSQYAWWNKSSWEFGRRKIREVIAWKLFRGGTDVW